MLVALLGDIEFGTNAICRGYKNGIIKLVEADSEKTTEPSYIGEYASAKGGRHDILYPGNQFIALVNINSGFAIS